MDRDVLVVKGSYHLEDRIRLVFTFVRDRLHFVFTVKYYFRGCANISLWRVFLENRPVHLVKGRIDVAKL